MSNRLDFHREMKAKNGGQWFDFEGLIRDVYVGFLSPGDVALDIGVNRGDHFLQMIPAVGEKGVVIGAEAAPEMVRVVRDHLRAAGYDRRRNVILHNVAVGDRKGETKFNYVKNQPGLSSIAAREAAAEYETETFTCKLTTIDSLLPFWHRVSFAKIDIEGGEYHALLGARRLLRKDRPLIVFEFDRDSPRYFGYKCEDLIGLLRQNRYRIFDLFGFEYTEESHLMESDVWNYAAVPVESRFDVSHVVFRSLREQGHQIPDLTAIL
jgi:FkbM family methyltransferase